MSASSPAAAISDCARLRSIGASLMEHPSVAALASVDNLPCRKSMCHAPKNDLLFNRMLVESLCARRLPKGCDNIAVPQPFVQRPELVLDWLKFIPAVRPDPVFQHAAQKLRPRRLCVAPLHLAGLRPDRRAASRRHASLRDEVRATDLVVDQQQRDPADL